MYDVRRASELSEKKSRHRIVVFMNFNILSPQQQGFDNEFRYILEWDYDKKTRIRIEDDGE